MARTDFQLSGPEVGFGEMIVSPESPFRIASLADNLSGIANPVCSCRSAIYIQRAAIA